MEPELPPNGTEFINPHTGGKVIFNHVYREEFPAHIEMLYSFAMSLEDGYCQLRGRRDKYPTVAKVASDGPRYNALSLEEKEQYARESMFEAFEMGFTWNAKHLLTHSGRCSKCNRQWGGVTGKMLLCLCGKEVLMHFINKITFITKGPGMPIEQFTDIIYNLDDRNETDPRDLGTVSSWDEAMGAASELYQCVLIKRVAVLSTEEYAAGGHEKNWFLLDESNGIGVGGHDTLIGLAKTSPAIYPTGKSFRLFFHWAKVEGKNVGQLVVVYVAANEKADEIKPLQFVAQ